MTVGRVGHDFFFKGRLIETSLGGPHFLWQRCSSLDMDTLSLCLGAWYQPQFGTRRSLGSGPGPDTSKQLAARDGYLTAVSQLTHVPAHAVVVAFLFLWECHLLLCCCNAQLLSWLVIICVPRATCDFVSRLGGWDTIFFFKGRLIETSLGGPHFCGSGA